LANSLLTERPKDPVAPPSIVAEGDRSRDEYHPDLSFFDALPAPFGPARIEISVGGIAARIHGLSARQQSELAARYGVFARTTGESAAGRLEVDLRQSPRPSFLRVAGGAKPEMYRLLTRWEGDVLLAWSYEWAATYRFSSGTATLVAASGDRVVFDRLVENFLRVAFAHAALEKGGVLLHAAGVVRDGAAYAFFGPSGSGKTTVTTLSPGAVVLSDDLLLVVPEGREFRASSVPFRGLLTPPATTDRLYPLTGLFRLVKDAEVFVEPLSRPRAVGEIVQSLPFVTDRPEKAPRILDVVSALAEAVPVGRLHFRKDQEFWRAVHRG
jgi:hypothetical protein